jgi:hypothetical protein
LGLAWWLPKEPTFEDFFLFLPRQAVQTTKVSLHGEVQRLERSLQKSEAIVAEAHDLLSVRIEELKQSMADLQLLISQLFPNSAVWRSYPTEDLMPQAFLQHLESLHGAYMTLLQRLEG